MEIQKENSWLPTSQDLKLIITNLSRHYFDIINLLYISQTLVYISKNNF